jgi:4-diphosphocytidyl-2-C-methyl-D-erythritol kinase
LELRAPAKLNLFLEVLAKRPDGYHDIATLMVAVSLFDTLKFKEESSGDIRLTCDNRLLSTKSDNLVMRAAMLLKRRTGCDKGVSIRLTKRIPLAAGLAGGSSDAAATLLGLNRLWRLRLSEKRLKSIGAELGSDVAFFFSTPASWCTGRGERVRPLKLAKPLWFVLTALPLGLSTAQVYRAVEIPDIPQGGEEIRRAVRMGNVEEIGRRLHNRLEPVAEKLCPAIRQVRQRLEKLSPAGALMSGSGTSVFALCRYRNEALRVARQLRHGLKGEASVFLVRSCPSKGRLGFNG